MKTALNTIPFADLGKYDDSNCFVWTGLILHKEEIPDVEKWLKEEVGFLKGGKIKDALKISGNVKGDEGRTDVLFIAEESFDYNCIARLMVDGLKWHCDFIPNYGGDYYGSPEKPEEEKTYDNEDCNKFVADMKSAGLETYHYKGRFHWEGPAVTVDSIQDCMSNTKVKVQWDNLGLQFVVYPKTSGKLLKGRE